MPLTFSTLAGIALLLIAFAVFLAVIVFGWVLIRTARTLPATGDPSSLGAVGILGVKR